MENKYAHLNCGYVTQVAYPDGWSQQVEFKPESQETADLIASHIASGQTLYLNVRKLETPKTFEAKDGRPEKQLLGFVGISQKFYDKLKG